MPSQVRPWGAFRTVVGSAAVAGLLVAAGIVSPAVADNYPSWDEVAAAQQSEQATQAEVDKIQSVLTQLQAKSEDLGRVAQIAGEKYNAAKVALEAASARAETLKVQVTDADTRAVASSRRAGQLIAQLARTGSGSLTLGLLFAGNNSDNLLDSLGTMSKLSQQATLIYRQATSDKNVAKSLADQARIAEDARQKLANDAQTAADSAQSAADAALAEVTAQKAAADQMYSQLATLKGTTADLEAGYAAGIIAQQEIAAQPPPPPTPPNPPNPTPPAPNASAVEGALAFAYAQLGKMYEFAGSGPDTWDCSGLTQAAYASVGVYIGAHLVSSQYYTMAAQGRLVPLNEMVAGDLIFYADGGDPDNGFYHVAMYVGGGAMIEAPREGVPVRVTSVRYYDILPYAGRPTP